jgi:hypothetical protein
MDLKGIISIAGLSGLYKVVAQTKGGLIVESLVDKKRIPTYANQRVSALDEISIYTSSEDAPLKTVLQKMAEKLNFGPATDHKASEQDILKFFEDVMPEFDKERVHTSDIRKVILWYGILQKNDLLKKQEDPAENEAAAKVRTAAEEKAKTYNKVSSKDSVAKPHKAAGARKTQTTRKTGTA